MKFFVTGGAGYIGSVLTPTLLERGHSVTVLDTFERGDTALAACCQYPNFIPVRGDARDERLLDELVPKADVAIPLAALVGAPICAGDPLTAQSLNEAAIGSLTRRMSSSQLLLYPTSNSGYGIGETAEFCTETSPLRPVSLYGRTKVAAERTVLDHGGASFRLATVFGMSPRMRIDLLVNDFTWRAVTDRAVVVFEGHFRRNYIHVRDVVKAFLHGVDNYGQMAGEAYNVGLTSANLSKIELCAKIAEHVPQFAYMEAPIGEDPDKRDYIVSNAKLESTGWLPDWTLDSGIAELVRGYRMLKNTRHSNV